MVWTARDMAVDVQSLGSICRKKRERATERKRNCRREIYKVVTSTALDNIV